MPVYEYVCEACGWKFEKLVRFSQTDLTPECPACGSNQTKKQISRVAAGSGGSDDGYASSGSCSSSGPFT
jgi:putative FmdB family regulatory protein